jgi:hypothetical protein
MNLKNSVFLSLFFFWKKKKKMIPSFSKKVPNKISKKIAVKGKHTLLRRTRGSFRVAIANEPIDGKVDGQKFFCVRIEDSGAFPEIMIGLSPNETYDPSESAWFGWNGLGGVGIDCYEGNLFYPTRKDHNIISEKISEKAKEIIVVLTVSNNGTKKEIRFLCDGKESKTEDVSKFLKKNRLFPVIILGGRHQQVTTIPIDEIKKRTPAVNKLLREGATENKNEKKEKKVAQKKKKTKKETKPKTTKATKKKGEQKNKK